mgnify:CR=1 FL=1
MYFPRIIYAIYPFDENGHVAGVYVGSTKNVEKICFIIIKLYFIFYKTPTHRCRSVSVSKAN